jgi:hypothetical protein
MIVKCEDSVVEVDELGLVSTNDGGLRYADNFYLTSTGFIKNGGNYSLFEEKDFLLFTLLEVNDKVIIIIHNQEHYLVNRDRIKEMIGVIDYEFIMGGDEYVV